MREDHMRETQLTREKLEKPTNVPPYSPGS
jgi:hypothetical protein